MTHNHKQWRNPLWSNTCPANSQTSISSSYDVTRGKRPIMITWWWWWLLSPGLNPAPQSMGWGCLGSWPQGIPRWGFTIDWVWGWSDGVGFTLMWCPGTSFLCHLSMPTASPNGPMQLQIPDELKKLPWHTSKPPNLNTFQIWTPHEDSLPAPF